MSRIPRLSRRGLATALLLVVPAVSARAQDLPVVLAHGVFSDSTTWEFMSSYLRSPLAVDPIARSTKWYRPEQFQANQLIQYLNGDSRTASTSTRIPFVAHSNGGLVSRRFSAWDARVNNLITIGTPHNGTALANRFREGDLFDYFSYFGSATAAPFDFYLQHDPAWPQWVYSTIHTLINWWNNVYGPIAAWGSEWVCERAGLCVVSVEELIGVVAPVVHDVAVGSDELAALNSESNLARESAMLQNRVYMHTAIDPIDGFFHLAFPNSYEDLGDVRSAGVGLYLMLFDYYDQHSDYTLWYHAPLWYDGAVALHMMDVDWYNLIGTYQGAQIICPPTQNCYIQHTVAASDGLIDYRSARNSPAFELHVPGNISHSQQLGSAVVGEAVKSVLVNRMQVALRPPAPTPLWATVNGSIGQATEEGAWGSFYPSVGGGTPPYTFHWYWDDGNQAGQTVSFMITHSQGLGLAVSDAAGASVYATAFLDYCMITNGLVCDDDGGLGDDCPECNPLNRGRSQGLRAARSAVGATATPTGKATSKGSGGVITWRGGQMTTASAVAGAPTKAPPASGRP